jgi:tRNA isopentenyl-2-thiomethyl-A-37 hydroxylase MiaE
MLDRAGQIRIQDLFLRENRSFLQYVRNACPWASDADKPLVNKLNRLADEELAALEVLANWMDEHNIPLPYLGAFATRFSSFNYVDVRKLLKPLFVEQRKELADLEANAKMLDGEARKQIDALVELNRKHLAEMEALG